MVLFDNIFITTVSCLIFQWLICLMVIVICGKPKKRPTPASPVANGANKAKTPQQPSTATTQNSSNVTFADTDDPKNKSCYGVDDGVFKKKKGTSNAKDGGGGKASPTKDKKKSNENDKKSSKKGKKDTSNKKKHDKDKDDKKKDDSDKTDLRSLTLEKNLAEAKKNPAAIDRSNRFIEGKDPGQTSGYALPTAPKKATDQKDQKKDASAYM